MSVIAKEMQTHWLVIRPLFSIHNEGEYDVAIKRLNGLIDEVGTNEQHPMYELLDTLGTVIHAYEEIHYPIPECNGSEMLQFLMDEHGLSPSDLPELGSESAVSDILNDIQELTVNHIRVLAKRFHISPAVFI